MSGERLADRHPAEAAIRERTGCSIVAVERDGDLVVNYFDGFRFRETDTIFVCGNESGVDRFQELFPKS